ncbi:MAG: RNA polymerase factor sigma-32 [Alphaproteobacteria bacterium]|nr:RNA polymerase factor sigma-32 [Alphaproteobacteria bacterium]
MVIKPSASLPVVTDGFGVVSYLEKIKKFPMLSEQEERELVLDFTTNNNLEAAHRLVVSHLRLAAKIALTYRRYGLPLADIISEANIGLMQAVKKFDLSKKVRLATYATWWIKAAINDFVLRSWSLVKIGTVAAQKKLFYNLNRIKARLGIYDNNELEPKVVKKIASELVVEEQDVVEMNRRLGGDSSLNVVVGDSEDMERQDMLVDPRQNIEASVAKKQELSYKHKLLMSCIKDMPEREAYIIKNRMLTENPQTLEEIGNMYNVSRERVRQLEKKAFDHLSELFKQRFSEAA